MRVAVVGHVEWVTFARVDHMPHSGEIVHADDVYEAPAGGGPVAAVQLLKLAGNCTFFTALGDDGSGHLARRVLEEMGVRVEATFRPEPQRTAFTHVDTKGERTITVMGSRLGPQASDQLPWDELAGTDAVYFCAGDDDALRAAAAHACSSRPRAKRSASRESVCGSTRSWGADAIRPSATLPSIRRRT